MSNFLKLFSTQVNHSTQPSYKAPSTQPDNQERSIDGCAMDSFSDTITFQCKDQVSRVLKQNFSSINSQNLTSNFTFDHSDKNKSKNLAYAISSKFPPKIKKQVVAIIQYYQNQLQSQRKAFWRKTQSKKIQPTTFELKMNMNNLQKQSQEKDKKISDLEERLVEKSQTISSLNQQIFIMMSKYSNLKKQLSPSKRKSSE